MTQRKIYIDRTRTPVAPSFDKKRELIKNQRVRPKKKQKLPREKRGLAESVLIKSIVMRRGLYLIVGAAVLSVLFLFPLVLDIKSYFWEKERVIYKEEDLVYNLFLMEGAGNRADGSHETRNSEFVVP